MNDDFEQLEREVERLLAELSPMLTVEPPTEVIVRTQIATRQALNEAWLVDQSTPTPNDETLACVRSAVRRELARTTENDTRINRPILRLAWPVVAAAAMIVISVGVFHYGGFGRQKTAMTTDNADQAVDLFVQAASAVWTEDAMIASLHMDLDSIEESMLTRTYTTSDGVEETLEDIESQLDELFTEPERLEYPVPSDAEDARLPVPVFKGEFVFMVNDQPGAIG